MLALLGKPVALIRDPVALIRDAVALIRDAVSFVCPADASGQAAPQVFDARRSRALGRLGAKVR